MPIVINKDSGLPENLPDANAALQSGTHEIPMYDPQGNFGSVAPSDAAELLQQGYTQPNSEQLKSLHEKGKYETSEQQLKTGLEGAASALTFGISSDIEQGLGVKSEDILKRQEHNPGTHALGEMAGLGASLLTGQGEAALLGRAAEAVVPTMEATFAGRVGSAAAKGAIENMIFQAGKEHEKLMLKDPATSAESVISEIGLAGLVGAGVGGGLGGVSELWKAGPGAKLEDFLSTLKARAGGLPAELKEAAGIHVPPEISAALSGSPENEKLLQILNESNSKAGIGLQDSLTEFHSNIKNAAAESLGRSEGDIENIHNSSDYDAGKELKDGLTMRMKEIVEPISKKYDEFTEQFKAAPISEQLKADIGNKVASSISELGLHKAASDTQLKAMNKFLEVLPKQENAHDLKLLATNLTEEHPFGSDTYRVGKILKGTVNDARESAISAHMGEKAPELLGEYQNTQAAYKDVKGMIDELNDRLHVGKSYGPQSFIDNIKAAAPEDILRRLNPKGDVELQTLLQNSFPEVAQAVQQNEVNKLIRSSLTNGELNTKKLFNNIQKLSPEHRSFMFEPEQLRRIEALKELQSRIPIKMNPSGTARTLDKLWDKVPASASAMAAMLFGHNPVAGYILGSVGQYLSREVPDAARLALLKFLGSSAEVSGPGLKAAVDVSHALAKAEVTLNAAVKDIFKAGGKVIQMPSSKVIAVLEEQVKRVAENDPEQERDMMSIGGATGHYLPDHAAALSMTASRNLQYLAKLRPVDKALSPLDSDPKPSAVEEAKYRRALCLAEQPLLITKAIKNGSITAEDMNHIHMMYPALYTRMSQKMMDQMIEKPTLPYATKMGVSSFLGQPLDNTLMPACIQSTQEALQMHSQQLMNMPIKPSATSMKSLEKLPSANQTPMQSREGHHNGRH